MKVFEIFKSISGEVAGCPQGSLATFIRFSGCNMKCHFCDAEDTQTNESGLNLTINKIINKVELFHLKNVIITGGEPLIQIKDLIPLTNELLRKGYNISIETNGSIIPLDISTKITIIMDYKLDQEKQMNMAAFQKLTKSDYVKFVITDGYTLERAIKLHKEMINAWEFNITKFAYSPVMPISKNIKNNLEFIYTQKMANLISKKLQENNLEGIINLQIHKILGME